MRLWEYIKHLFLKKTEYGLNLSSLLLYKLVHQPLVNVNLNPYKRAKYEVKII